MPAGIASIAETHNIARASSISWLGKADADAATIFRDKLDASSLERYTYRLQRRGIPWTTGFDPSHGSRRNVSAACQIANAPPEGSSRHSDLIGTQHYNLDIISV
ncbi:hypothetical protein A6U85_31815 [Agrobacterium sp. 13-626]|jgi:hypothetical protein|nr:hypothetical protein CN09_00825 [Rhizobium rhizogenes]OCI99374.1 hypothetical protein A6U85_31815 [Agrobacterium sp. 13-626]OCJ16942.1 hypothetical protein A6U88_33725 [Agrobacterium sp. B131/95]